jgi:hypothetical protein
MPNGDLVVSLPGGENPSMVVGVIRNDLVITIPEGPEIHIPGSGFALGESGQPVVVSFPGNSPITVGTVENVTVEFPSGSPNQPFDLSGHVNIVELPEGGTITIELIPPIRSGPHKIRIFAKNVAHLRGTSTQMMA